MSGERDPVPGAEDLDAMLSEIEDDTETMRVARAFMRAIEGERLSGVAMVAVTRDSTITMRWGYRDLTRLITGVEVLRSEILRLHETGPPGDS